MKDIKKSRKVKDIKVKTQLAADSFAPIKATAPNEPASSVEIEESTVLINPDIDSMESRG